MLFCKYKVVKKEEQKLQSKKKKQSILQRILKQKYFPSKIYER